MFPTIRRLEDVLPAVAGRSEFAVGMRDGYQFIDYHYAQSDSFDCPIRRECRGLKFDAEGNLIARPFHKFFNLHERPDAIPDLTGGHVVMDKMDGSMVHPARVEGKLAFMTRAGVTEQAKLAMETAEAISYGKQLLDFCSTLTGLCFTPIFEFTSPHNQIVVRYAEANLTLLAVRSNLTGDYWTVEETERAAANWGIPSVNTYGDAARDIDAFVARTKALPDTEGYVIRCGQWFGKMKADAYVASHRAKSGLLFEKDVLKLVLENKVDDVVGLLDKEEAQRLQDWAQEVDEQIAHVAAMVHRISTSTWTNAQGDRANFAFLVNNHPQLTPMTRSACFATCAERPAMSVLRDLALRHTTNAVKARSFLADIHVRPWSPIPPPEDQ